MTQHAPRSTWLVLLAMLVAVVWLNGHQQRHDAGRWLAEARAAAARLDYHGEQTVDLALTDRRLRARVRVVHVAPDRTRLDYLSPAELAGTVAVCADGQCRRYDPRLGRSVSALAEPGLPPAGVAGYRVHTGPGGPVAGRDTRRISLKRGRWRRDYWLDRETGLLLASRGPLGDTRFVSFALGPGSQPVDFGGLPPAVPGRSLSPSELSARLGFQVLEPRWLPRGFARADSRLYTCACCGMEAAQLVYRSAVGCVSLFEQRADQTCCVAEGACGRSGQCLASGRDGEVVVARLDRSPLLVALGDAPRADLRRLLDSVPGG